MTTTRIYQLDTISQNSIMGTHVAPFEDSSGVDTTQISLGQLTRYFFNGASTTDDSGPFSGYPLIVGNNSYVNDGSNSNVTIFGPSNEIWRDDGGGNTDCSAFGYNNSILANWGSTAIGYRNHTVDSRTSAFGHKNTVIGGGCSAFGSTNLISGEGCTGSGYYNSINGETFASSVFGAYNQVYAGYSNAIGYNNYVSTPNSTGVGSSNVAAGLYSQAVGYGNVTSMVTWNDNYFDITGMNAGERTFVVSGDQTALFYQYILVQGNEDPLNNGIYGLNDVSWDGSNTIIVVNQNILGPSISNGRIYTDINFNEATYWPISAVDTGTKTFTVLGNHLVDYENSVKVEVSSSSYNDGYYTINDVTYDGNTHIIVNETIPTSDANGNITGNKADSDLGWGTSAFGYKNSVTDSESSAFGHHNRINARLGTAAGTYNIVNSTHSSSVGYQNTCSDYYSMPSGGSGWGASAFGYKNNAFASECSAFGHKNNAFARMSSALGNENTASGYYSCAIGIWNIASHYGSVAQGNNNTASGYYSVASGYNNTASGNHSTACGYNNTASASWGTSAVGHENTASTNQASAFGHNNTASGHSSSAFGFGCAASGLNSSAFGYQAIARPDNTTNIGGGIIIRADNTEGAGNEFVAYSGVTNVVMTKYIDLTSTSTYTITVPTGCSFFVDEVGIIIINSASVTGQPTVEFGWTGTLAGLIAPVATTNLLTANSREVYTSLLSYDGLKTLTFTITSGAAASSITGRAYFKGLLVEDALL